MNEDIDRELGHTDDEPGMIANDLSIIERYARELREMVEAEGAKGESDFPHWWQSKIILAKENIVKAKHYLRAELEKPQGQMENIEAQGSRLKSFSDFVSESHVNEARGRKKDPDKEAKTASYYVKANKDEEFSPRKSYKMMGDPAGMAGYSILTAIKRGLVADEGMESLPTQFDVYMDDMDLVLGDKTVGKMSGKTLAQAVQVYTNAVKKAIKMAQQEA